MLLAISTIGWSNADFLHIAEQIIAYSLWYQNVGSQKHHPDYPDPHFSVQLASTD